MEFETLAPRARWLFYLQAFARLFMFWVPACLFGAVVVGMAVGPLMAAVAALAALFAIFVGSVWIPSLAFERWGFRLGPDELLITSGVVVRRVTAIPLCRIQHVDTRQGPIEQWLGLTRLQISTASGMGADGVIPGLELERADELRKRLVGAAEGDDGV